MAVPLLCLVLFLAMIHHSNGAYCICNSGLSDSVLQSSIDYACGAGADCTQIMQSGPCYNPNTVKDHCNYAVNSYYQRSNQGPGTCNFSGTANISQTIPNQVPGCVYPSSGGNNTTPTTPTTPPTPGSVPPFSNSTTPPTPGSIPPFSNSTTPPSPFLISPPTDVFSAATFTTVTHLFYSFTLTLLLHGLVCRS